MYRITEIALVNYCFIWKILPSKIYIKWINVSRVLWYTLRLICFINYITWPVLMVEVITHYITDLPNTECAIVLLVYLVSGEGCGTEIVGSLSCLFSSTSTVMVCWSSSRTRSSSWVLNTNTQKITRREETRMKSKQQDSNRKNRPTHKHTDKQADLIFSLLPTHHTLKCLMLWKHVAGNSQNIETAQLTMLKKVY